MTLFFDILGWIGAVLLLAAYFLVSNKRLEASSLTYQNLNIVGGLLLLGNNIHYGAYPSGFLNLVWSIIAVVAIVKALKARKQP